MTNLKPLFSDPNSKYYLGNPDDGGAIEITGIRDLDDTELALEPMQDYAEVDFRMTQRSITFTQPDTGQFQRAMSSLVRTLNAKFRKMNRQLELTGHYFRQANRAMQKETPERSEMHKKYATRYKKRNKASRRKYKK